MPDDCYPSRTCVHRITHEGDGRIINSLPTGHLDRATWSPSASAGKLVSVLGRKNTWSTTLQYGGSDPESFSSTVLVLKFDQLQIACQEVDHKIRVSVELMQHYMVH